MAFSPQAEVISSGRTASDTNLQKTNISTSNNANTPPDARGSVSGARATDSARVAKFTKELSRPAIILVTVKVNKRVCIHAEKLRELSWSGIPPYMRPNIWRLLPVIQLFVKMGYASPNTDRREGVLARKRLEYVDCVSQYYDIPDSERSDDEINMLRQVYSFTYA
ncbi:hypothetical protein BHE74_00020811 [Ensete ventricosum]|nr:hypothetical protein BHE74_00020811 [Ensete ventricosum]